MLKRSFYICARMFMPWWGSEHVVYFWSWIGRSSYWATLACKTWSRCLLPHSAQWNFARVHSINEDGAASRHNNAEQGKKQTWFSTPGSPNDSYFFSGFWNSFVLVNTVIFEGGEKQLTYFKGNFFNCVRKTFTIAQAYIAKFYAPTWRPVCTQRCLIKWHQTLLVKKEEVRLSRKA